MLGVNRAVARRFLVGVAVAGSSLSSLRSQIVALRLGVGFLTRLLLIALIAFSSAIIFLLRISQASYLALITLLKNFLSLIAPFQTLRSLVLRALDLAAQAVIQAICSLISLQACLKAMQALSAIFLVQVATALSLAFVLDRLTLRQATRVRVEETIRRQARGTIARLKQLRQAKVALS